MKNRKFDKDSAFKSIVGENSSEKKEKKVEELLVQTSLYITTAQHKALKLKAVIEESDMSKIVRDILEKELAEYLD